MDVVGPLCASSEGNRYLLTLKDVFSKWFEAIPLPNTTSEKVLRALQMIYARFGHPLQMNTDNATYFRSQVMREACQRAGITPTYNPQSNSVERTHRDLNTMLCILCHQHAADWEEVLPAALLALRSAVHESTGVTPFACLYGREPATPLDLVSRASDAPLAAHTYVRRLEDHRFCAHQAEQAQLARAIQCTGRRYDNERDAMQPGEKLWLFTSRLSADRKLTIPYTGPWRVTRQLSGTLRTIRPEGDWCRQPRDITVSLNRLKRCHGESRAPQRVDLDLRQLEDVDDDAEGPMRNSWVTNEGAAAAQALNQEAGDVHAPSLRERSTSAAESQPAPRLFSRHQDPEDMAPYIVVHHSGVNPEPPSTAQPPSSRNDSATMTTPDLALPSEPQPGPLRAWTAPRTQLSFDKSALVRPCSSQVTEESVLPPVCEELKDDVFSPSPSAPSHRASSTTVTAPSATDTAPSTTETAPNTDSGSNDHRGQKRAEASSDTSYSRGHRAMGTGPSNYPKRPHRLRTLTSSEEDEPPPRPRRPWSPDSDYSREHRATATDRHRYPKRHLRGRLLALFGRDPVFGGNAD